MPQTTQTTPLYTVRELMRETGLTRQQILYRLHRLNIPTVRVQRRGRYPTFACHLEDLVPVIRYPSRPRPTIRKAAAASHADRIE